MESRPGPPENVKAVAISSDSVLVLWLPPNPMNGQVLAYKVYMKTMLEGQPVTKLQEVYL